MPMVSLKLMAGVCVSPNWKKGRAEASSLGEEQIHSKCFEFTVNVFILCWDCVRELWL